MNKQATFAGLSLSRPHLMVIINATPDSFSDGGLHQQVDLALKRVESAVNAGASMIDIGGESTRPGAEPVSGQQELDRVLPIIEQVRSNFDIPISVDTSTASVMRAAVGLGATMINDVRALQREGALQAAVDLGVPVCLMHMQGQPDTMQQAPSYQQVTQEVGRFLQDRAKSCIFAGIPAAHIMLDPGFGFGKQLIHNVQLMLELDEITALGYPVLIGVSRKSMVGHLLSRQVEQRVLGSTLLAARALERGAWMVRSHDIDEPMELIRLHQRMAETLAGLSSA